MLEPSIDYSCAHCGHSQTYRLVPAVARDPASTAPQEIPLDRPAVPALRHKPDIQAGAGYRSFGVCRAVVRARERLRALPPVFPRWCLYAVE